jgi:hypothetical protein
MLTISAFHKFAIPLMNLDKQTHSSTEIIRLVMMTRRTSVPGMQLVMTGFVIRMFFHSICLPT